MKTWKLANKTDLSSIDNIEDLREEARRLNIVVRQQEMELRVHLKALPKELMKAGVGSVVPPMLKGKMAAVALTAGSALLGNFFVGKAAASTLSILSGSAKKAGLMALGQVALKWLLKKRK